MFYSPELFQAQGPLARVWMSANMERKLSKQSILQANVSNSVHAIVAPTQVPLALRVTGKLLLGVVRIYNRKARYLLDDCSEALIKLKLAFRPSGTHDIPVALGGGPGREALLIPDAITADSALEFTLPDFDMTQPDEIAAPTVSRKTRASTRDINLQEDFSSSQYLHEVARKEEELGLAPAMDLELDIDFGLDFEEPQPSRMDQTTAMDVEVGRDALHASIEDDPFADLELEQQRRRGKARESTEPRDFDDDRVRIADDEGDIQMGEDLSFNLDDQSMLPPPPLATSADVAAELQQRRRESESPLSDMDPDFAKEVEREYELNQLRDMYDQEDHGGGGDDGGDETEAPVVRRPAQRAKKQKLFVPDSSTILTTAEMKEVQRDPSEIQREQQFLERDPHMMALLDAHLSRSIVANVVLDARSGEWAPELQGMLSLRPRSASELKRKRRGEAGAEEEDEQEAAARDAQGAKSPRLELDLGGDSTILGGNQTTMVLDDGTVVEIPADRSSMSAADRRRANASAEPEAGAADVTLPVFDETIAPIVHPADSGPVSLATKHAVHVLRDLFGAEAEHDDEKRTRATVVFQDLLPEGRATKADATRMFFECLVLATKDAIKVDQASGLGAPIRVRGKRGLWGKWAEREAGREMAQGEEDEEGEEEGPQQGGPPGGDVDAGVASPSMPRSVAVGA